MNLYPYFPHLLSDLDKTRYMRCVNNSGENSWVSWKLAQGRPYIFYVSNEIKFPAHTIKLYIFRRVRKIAKSDH
jgi:hypothetical protein